MLRESLRDANTMEPAIEDNKLKVQVVLKHIL